MRHDRIWVVKTVDHIDQQVLLKGWVWNRRDHGKLIFIDLRDRSGEVQMVFNPAVVSEETFSVAKTLRAQDVIAITGKVLKRPDSMVNPRIPTGTVEVEGTELKILSHAHDLPFDLSAENFNVDENVRLKYRYLDLRRPAMQNKMMLRSKLFHLMRQYLVEHEFVEIETPMLTKSTPEGARDFIVPSRLQPGKFYALPQSPQQYKQLLMVAGLERYFQFARCVRDEDLRADRGFEFTQLDLEMSFVEREDVMGMIEGMVIHSIEQMDGKRIKQKPFPVLSYKEAFEKYGADKFDMRDDPKDPDELAFAWVVDWPTFEQDAMTGNWTYSHNPFTGPRAELQEELKNIDITRLKEPEMIAKIHSLVSTQYDLVCNGYEVGGGGIRIYDPEALARVFEIIGHDRAKIQSQFGHILEAFSYGVPPHGGIALGLDRLVMLLTRDNSLKEVMAFPMTSSGKTAVMDAPSEVDEGQLIEVALSIRGRSKGSVFADICGFLDGKQVKYKKFEHAEVRTSEEAAAARGTSLASGAKALLVKAEDGTFHMIVISASRKLDSKKLREALTTKKTRFADPEEVKKLTGCEPGGVPPFGNLFRLKVWVDRSIESLPTIDFNAGERTRSIEMRASDFLALVPHETVDVALVE